MNYFEIYNECLNDLLGTSNSENLKIIGSKILNSNPVSV